MEILIHSFLFLIAVIAFFYLPGSYINYLLRIKLNLLEDLFISTVFGLLLFTIFSFFASYLNLQIIVLLVILLLDVLAIKIKFWKRLKIDRKDILPFISVLILCAIFSIPLVTSGPEGDNLRLMGINSTDALWHLSLINELRSNFPPNNPGFSGESLIGYHFFTFFLMSKIGVILNIPSILLVFKLFPVLVSFLWGVGVYTFINKWTKNRLSAVIGVFLTMFGGSFVYFSWLEGYKSLSLDGGYGIMQPATSLINPPFAISIIFLVAFLFSLYEYLKSKSYSWLWIISLIVGLTPLFKVYGGIIIMIGFLMLFLYEIFRRRFKIIPFSLIAATLFFLTYWSFADRNAHLILHPLWPIHNNLRDNFPWYGYDEKIYTYSQQGVISGLIRTELYAFFIFFIGNLGTRIIGLFLGLIKVIKESKKPSLFFVVFISMTVLSLIIPVFFIQTGKVFETIQFTWYYLFLTSILSAIGYGYFLSLNFNLFLKLLFIIIVILATIPSAVSSIRGYLNFNDITFVNKDLYNSLNFLSMRGSYNDIVLILPEEEYSFESERISKWYYSDSKPFIPALANKSSFLSNQYIEFEHLDKEKRLRFIEQIIEMEKGITGKDIDVSEEFKNDVYKKLKNYGIVYIYSYYPLKITELFDNIKLIYSNPKAYIYEVK